MKAKKILWLVLGLGIVFVAHHLGFGPYRPRFPVKVGASTEPPSVLTREQDNLLADIRAIGLRRDHSQIVKVRAALKEEHPFILITALLALGRLGATESVEDIRALQKRLQDDSHIQSFAALALARIQAESAVPQTVNQEQLRQKIKHFLTAADLSVRQIYKGASWYIAQWQAGRYRDLAPFEVQALRQIAEITSEAYEKGVQDAFTVVGLDFSRDHAAQLKAQLGQMSREQRVQWLVDLLSKKRVGRWEEEYEVQALADEGLFASKAIITKLREMRTHRTQYPYNASFALLFRALICIGDTDSIPVVRSFLNDSDRWVRYYAEQTLRHLEQGWRVVRAIDY
ncbi:MAG: HEAT repeat domain-containing protein [Candidatus Bathyarchaeia archaeon]